MSRKNNNEDFIVRYTNKHIMEKLESIEDNVKAVHKQASITNGRVTHLEKKSVGNWISNNTFKFVIYTLIFICIVISDIRHPLIKFLVGLI